MARSRNIKPGLYKNEDLAECSVWARFIFPGLWMLADREGRLEDRPKRIKGELLPFDTQEVEPLLQELASKRDAQGTPFIVRYQIDGVSYIQISKFSEHQNPHYSEKESVIKPPNSENSTPRPPTDSGSTPENGALKEGGKRADSLIPDSLIPDSLKQGSEIQEKQGAGGRKKRGTPCPANFEVTSQMASWAISMGLPEPRITPETEAFLDHHTAKGTLFSDWDAAWRTWIRNAVKFASGKR